MIAELYEMREIFIDADGQVSALLRRITEEAGLTSERREQMIDFELARLLDRGQTRCGPFDQG